MGELAALGASAVWSFTSIWFTLAGQRVGSAVVNRLRLLFAVIILSIVHWILFGSLFPREAEIDRWVWLGLAGVIGMAMGDASLFQAFVLIGTRRSMLLVTLTPVFSTLIAWIWLGETLEPIKVAAIIVIVAGITWVVSERKEADTKAGAQTEDRRSTLTGVLLGILAAFGTSAGFVLSKRGLYGVFSPLSAALIRMSVATVFIWILTLVRRQVLPTLRTFYERPAFWYIACGSVTGPVIGIWLSMVAVQRAPVGVASALMSLSPIALIPLSYRVFNDRITPRAVFGAFIALAGATALFLI